MSGGARAGGAAPGHAAEPYRPRPIRFLEVLEFDGWRLKLYSIRYGAAPLDRALYDEGLALARPRLPRPAVAAGRPGLGFAIAHQGRTAHYLVLAWWDNGNELPLGVFVRPLGPDGRWREAAGGESVCVWDLQVIGFERDAYVETMMSGRPDAVAYLARRMAAGG